MEPARGDDGVTGRAEENRDRVPKGEERHPHGESSRATTPSGATRIVPDRAREALLEDDVEGRNEDEGEEGRDEQPANDRDRQRLVGLGPHAEGEGHG